MAKIGQRALRVIKDRSGASIIVVMCLSVIFLLVGVSVLVSAFNISSAQVRYRENAVAEVFAKQFAAELTEEITKPFDANESVFKSIAEEIYRANANGGTAPVAIDGTSLVVTNETAGFAGENWLVEPDAIQLSIVFTDVRVTVTQDYASAIDPITVAGTEIVPGLAALPQQTHVEGTMRVKITVQYHDIEHTLYADYLLDCTTEGSLSGSSSAGKVVSGGFTLKEYSRP